MTANIRHAVDPAGNAVVHAAAGTGKTWLLTSRIVRLLLAGADPGAILAITFTRKAAQEMTDRVHQRLFTLAAASEAQLERMLTEIGVTATAESRSTARALYERVLASPYTLRTTTFHAFCQELLRRFAFEAAIAPGFEVIEDGTSGRREAWQAFTRELTHAPPGPVVDAMDLLLRELGSLTSVRAALYDFLDRASDWWAFTEGADDPVAFAIARLTQAYGPIDGDAWLTLSARADFRALCRDFIAAVGPAPAKSLAKASDAVEQVLANNDKTEESFASLVAPFLTLQGEPRQLGPKLAAREAPGGRTLAEIHGHLCDALGDVLQAKKTAAAFAATSGWYRCGAQLLDHYQRLKQERNQLDFADLEWLTYRLLTTGDHAEWVQYKLDRRIDHLLIDEFQDTNPTQWRLVLPLLQELAAGDPERRRSVFLVGDEKQSIYRFRRAEAQLFRQAHDWLIAHTGAVAQTQDTSWRSSPAILAFVNLIFGDAHSDEPDGSAFSLPDFRPHSAHYASRPGHVELHPLIERSGNDMPSPSGDSHLRNPLTTPRESDEDRRYREEAAWIAARIRGLIEDGVGIEANDVNRPPLRPIRYGDIFVLLRDRTHTQAYEDALREAGLPFLGASRGQFQDALEIRDLTNLLRVLIAPHDDLALAGVLRSPLFAFTDEALMELADGGDQPWWQRLADVAGRRPAAESFARAWRLLAHWHHLADRVPVHDLLDRIFFEGDVMARYASATPVQLRARVRANLTHFIALALEFDSGRYPSLSRFLRAFAADRPAGGEPSPDAMLSSPEDCVRVLTIHAAKGLEAPVVFLADAARGGTPRSRVPWTLIDWPVEAAGPEWMLLGGRHERLDRIAHAAYEGQLAAARREEANLLYVAVTRARQLLFISGCAPARGNDLGWYGFIQARLQRTKDLPPADGVEMSLQHLGAKDGAVASVAGTLRFGVMPTVAPAPSPSAVTIASDARLHRPFAIAGHPMRRRPSALPDDQPLPPGNGGHWRDGRARGIVIHRALDLATTVTDREQARRQWLRDYEPTLPANWLDDCWQEAIAVVDTPALRELFESSRYREARNELPLLYRDGSDEVYGFIDRVVRTDSTTIIVDYKTNRLASTTDLAALAAHYAPQLELYARGLQKIWPKDRFRALLVFTRLPRAIEVPLTI